MEVFLEHVRRAERWSQDVCARRSSRWSAKNEQHAGGRLRAGDLGDHAVRPDQGAAVPAQPAEQRQQVHRGRARSRWTRAVASAGPADWIAVPRHGHRHRHDRRSSSARLFQAFTQADASTTRQLWRHRPGPRHHPPASARMLGGDVTVDERAGRGLDVHAAAAGRGRRSPRPPADDAGGVSRRVGRRRRRDRAGDRRRRGDRAI